MTTHLIKLMLLGHTTDHDYMDITLNYPFNLITRLNNPLFHAETKRVLWDLEQSHSLGRSIPYRDSEEYFQQWATRRRATMINRIKKKERNSLYRRYPALFEIENLMRESQGRCAVSGIYGLWTTVGVPSCLNPFLLVIDHKEPISKGGGADPGNLQIILRCLNQVKSSESEDELLRWLNRARETIKQVELNI
ncbi:MAG: hypothetical protein EXX96DRAFT_547565 [Benjaminiella poitrasii]|nr:MAG: hypothetical protein EXX96DRAFT_547565 [Benjaminiella poitrasii]